MLVSRLEPKGCLCSQKHPSSPDFSIAELQKRTALFHQLIAELLDDCFFSSKETLHVEIVKWHFINQRHLALPKSMRAFSAQ